MSYKSNKKVNCATEFLMHKANFAAAYNRHTNSKKNMPGFVGNLGLSSLVFKYWNLEASLNKKRY